MWKYLKSNKRLIVDFFYSFVAYALPTFALQFIIQPIIARMTDADTNGLFISLFSVVKLCVSVLIIPLTNLRLLNKESGKRGTRCDKSFNSILFFSICVALLALAVSNAMLNPKSDVVDYLLLSCFLILICLHDYYSVEFRLILNYKKILIDNTLIIVGYGIGSILFWLTQRWQFIFIMGYVFGTIFVFLSGSMWKCGFGRRNAKTILPKYGQLGLSAALSNATVYCDKLIIYPALGGYSVSVYNSAAVVSKAISVLSAPLRNVLLSYIVDRKTLHINKKKLKKGIWIAIGGLLAVYICFYFASVILCRFLYPAYYQDALHYVPLITAAIILETSAGIMNIVLLRFAKAKLQAIISAMKTISYVLSVLIFSIILKMGLLGFCIASLCANIIQVVLVTVSLKKYIEFV